MSKESDVQTILGFLDSNPESLSWKSRKGSPKPDIAMSDGLRAVRARIEEAYDATPEPVAPKTIPDPAVRIVLEEYFGIESARAPQVEKEHQLSMGAENFIGELLESYISQVNEERSFGWVRVWGDVVKATDFIRKLEGNRWILLQIKNRNNSENSSSGAIRDGTKIIKWHRTIAQSGNTRWDKFPDEALKQHLSEDGFRQFVRDYLAQFRQGKPRDDDEETLLF